MADKETKVPIQDEELDYSVNIGNLNGGSIPEIFAKLHQQVMDNIRDVNTTATKKRSITLKITYAPTADRKAAQTMLDTTMKLAPHETMAGTIHIAKVKGKVIGFVHDPAQDELRFGESASPKQQ